MADLFTSHHVASPGIHSPSPRLPVRVLLVEQDARNQEALQHAFTRAGYAVRVDALATEDLLTAALWQYRWDLVVVDVDAPLGPDGVVQHVRELQPNVPVLVIGEGEDTEHLVHALRDGADDYLSRANLSRVVTILQHARSLLRGDAPQSYQRLMDEQQDHRDRLEEIVSQRTAALLEINEQLRAEVARRQQDKLVLQQSEARYRAIVEDQMEMVCRFRPDGELTFVNKAYARAFGRTPESLVGENLFTLLPEEDRALLQAHFDTFSRDQPVQTVEHRVQVAGGETRWQHWTDRALFDAEGHIIEFQATGRDITDQKRAELERERLFQELDAFSHTVAHDLKSPLMTLIGFSDLLEKEHASLAPEQIQEFSQYIARYAHKMNSIIDELLLLASVRREDIEMEPVNMAGVIEDALQRLGYLIDQHEPIITQPRTWPEAWGYSPWVAEVWVNYISNAIKYGGRPPRVELGSEPLPNGHIRFWVRDNGVGLKPEDHQRLFKPFESLGQVKANGHGLGLSIVQRIVTHLGGTVAVESNGPGCGSTFSFTLPATQPEQA